VYETAGVVVSSLEPLSADDAGSVFGVVGTLVSDCGPFRPDRLRFATRGSLTQVRVGSDWKKRLEEPI
jgi:hypothetical protein